MHPPIDHQYLSPSGNVSKRAQMAADKRIRRELFGDGLPYPGLPPQPSNHERLLRQAAELDGLADRGMKPRAYRRKAAKLREQAAKGE